DLGILAVEEPARRVALAGLEADEPRAAAGGAEGDLDRAGGAEGLGRVGERARRDEGDVAGVGDPGLPGELAHGEAIAVGREEGDLLALDLDADSGEDRERVAAIGGDLDLLDCLGEERAVDAAARLRR